MNIIPADEIIAANVGQLRQNAIDACNLAVTGATISEQVARDIVPSDLNGTGNTQAISLTRFVTPLGGVPANTWTIAYQGTISQNTSICIYGFGQLAASPQIDALLFSQGAAVQGYFYELLPIYASTTVRIGYFDTPVLYLPEQLFSMSVRTGGSLASGTQEEFVLLGVTVEPQGINLAPFNYPPAVAAALATGLEAVGISTGAAA